MFDHDNQTAAAAAPVHDEAIQQQIRKAKDRQ